MIQYDTLTMYFRLGMLRLAQFYIGYQKPVWQQTYWNSYLLSAGEHCGDMQFKASLIANLTNDQIKQKIKSFLSHCGSSSGADLYFHSPQPDTS